MIKISKWFMLTMPVMVLFYKENGLDLQEVLFLQGVYSVFIVLFEIPSGYAADVLGRKNTVLIGVCFGIGGFSLYSLGASFFVFFFAEMFLGIGQSMISGADSALLYDSLREAGKDEDYAAWEGRMISAGNFAEALAGVCAGMIASLGLRYNFISQTFVTFLALPAVLMVREPSRDKIGKGNPLTKIKDVLLFSLVRESALRFRIIISSLIGISTLTMAWFVQPYFIKIEMPVEWFGVLWTSLNLTVGVAALKSRELRRIENVFLRLFLIILIVSLSYFFAGLFFSFFGMVVFFVFYVVRGLITPFLKNLVNELCPSESRATVLSIRNFIIRLGFAGLGPFLGWTRDFWGLRWAFWSGGLFFFFSGSLVLYMIYKVKSDREGF